MMCERMQYGQYARAVDLVYGSLESCTVEIAATVKCGVYSLNLVLPCRLEKSNALFLGYFQDYLPLRFAGFAEFLRFSRAWLKFIVLKRRGLRAPFSTSRASSAKSP